MRLLKINVGVNITFHCFNSPRRLWASTVTFQYEVPSRRAGWSSKSTILFQELSLLHVFNDLLKHYLFSERVRKGSVEGSLIFVYLIILCLLNGKCIILPPSPNHLTTGNFYPVFFFLCHLRNQSFENNYNIPSIIIISNSIIFYTECFCDFSLILL